MRVGTDLPYFASPIDVRRYATAVEEMGFDFVGFSSHVASTLDSPFPAPMFTFDEPWRESFTLAAFLAAVTSRIELNPAMVLLPLYPPVLAAKQAAEVDNLSGGRLRLAASVGWNTRECESLGVDPSTRAARFEEQVQIVRRLWSERSINHDSEHFSLRDVGISARPPRPIPIWFGAGRMDRDGFPSPRGVERAARLADGFKFAAPTFLDNERLVGIIGDLRAAVAAAGRDVESFGVEVRIIAHLSDPADWPAQVALARATGASHLGFANRIAGGTVDDQLGVLRRFVDSTHHLW